MAVVSEVDVPADAAAAAFVEMMLLFGATAPNGWARERDGAAAMVTGAPVPTLNGVICGRRGTIVAASELVDAVAATGLPHCIQIRDGDAAVEMVARSRGMTEEADAIPFMVLDAVPGAPGDVEVRRLLPSEEDLHLDLVTAGFEVPEDLFAALRGGGILKRDGVAAYVVDVDGEPVATGLGLTLGGYVGVFSVTTLPAYRGRGYGAALTCRAAADGFAAGARAAVLQSSPLAERLYERLGFRTLERWAAWVRTPGS